MTAADYAGVSVAVLGASGFIGRRVVGALRAHGAVVHAIVRSTSTIGLPPDGVTVADLAEPGAAANALARIRPRVVFNLAGYGVDRTERDPERMQALNARLVAELCDATAALATPAWRGYQLVHVGSALEYGRAKGRLTEDTPAMPDTDYGRTKLAGTRAAIEAGVTRGTRAVVARLFTVYGPGEHAGRLLPALLEATHTNDPVALTVGAQARDFTYVDDVVEGLLRLGTASGAPGTVVNLATGRLTSVRCFIEAAAAVLGIERSRLAFGTLPTREEEMYHDEVDVSRLRQMLDWVPPTSVVEGVRRTREALDAC